MTDETKVEVIQGSPIGKEEVVIPKSNVSTQETITPEKAEDGAEPEIDYKAELELTKARLDKAEYKLRKQNIESKKKESEEEQAPEVLDTDVDTLIEQKVNQRLEQSRVQDSIDTIEDYLDQMSGSEDEKELIRLHYEKSIVKTGFSKVAIKNDLTNAKLLANAPKYIKRNKEIGAALKSKNSMATAGMGSNLDTPVSTEDMSKAFDATSWKFMKDRNWSEEKIRKAYVATKQR